MTVNYGDFSFICIQLCRGEETVLFYCLFYLMRKINHVAIILSTVFFLLVWKMALRFK